MDSLTCYGIGSDIEIHRILDGIADGIVVYLVARIVHTRYVVGFETYIILHSITRCIIAYLFKYWHTGSCRVDVLHVDILHTYGIVE